MSTEVPNFELENVGAGESPFRLSAAVEDDEVDAVVVLLQRDYHCRNCRQQVQAVAARYDEFEAENALVVSVLPEPADRAADWQESYALPFPLLADPEKAVGDDLDQPTRFGFLGDLHDLVGRMPEALVLDVTGDEAEVAFVHRGRRHRTGLRLTDCFRPFATYKPIRGILRCLEVIKNEGDYRYTYVMVTLLPTAYLPGLVVGYDTVSNDPITVV